MAELAAVVPVTKEQLANLAALDAWLDGGGPKYVRNATIGAAAGAAVALVIAKKKGITTKSALLGAGAVTAGGFLLFQIAKWASKKEHEHLAILQPLPETPSHPVVTRGAFAGAPRTLYPTVDAHEVYR